MSDVTFEPPLTAEQKFEHDGSAATLTPIVIVNTLLTIITLSIYRFWAKTRVRQYLWDQTSLNGDKGVDENNRVRIPDAPGLGFEANHDVLKDTRIEVT